MRRTCVSGVAKGVASLPATRSRWACKEIGQAAGGW
jgi:hypothetical protein